MRTRPGSINLLQQKRQLVACALQLIIALAISIAAGGARAAQTSKTAPKKIDFNQDIRPIITENCFKCHGPDDGARKSKLRFDLRAEALKPAKSGATAIVPGAPEKSELMARITAADPDDRMPPLKSGKNLTAAQIESLRAWIAQGAPYATHWAYVKPVRPPLPEVRNQRWPRNPIDRFILARLESEGLTPSPPANRYALIRRVSLDLTGLPPTLEEVDQFVNDHRPQAYENLVDRLLNKPAFGEHWARLWLDLARYADSAGYADDPPRTIWAYRDYVIKAFNANKPFDRFTLEQIAGDLLDDADDEDVVATAFHRNTMTNNEGGTTDEEFRNAAVVDRVNTTMAVWMATSMACAQCHNHKYDPISQQEYFSFFAFFNNTQDADLTDESPLLELYTPQQKEQRAKWQSEIAQIEKKFKTATPALLSNQAAWEQNFPLGQAWLSLQPASFKSKEGGKIVAAEDNAVEIAPLQNTETYTVESPVTAKQIAGLRLETLASSHKSDSEQAVNGGFAISHVAARLVTSAPARPPARFVRVELPGKHKFLSLAEVQVFAGKDNLALQGEASQSSTAFEGKASLALDGNTDGDYDKTKSTTHTEESDNPWWEVDLKQAHPVDRIVIWNRTDHDLHTRLSDFRILVLDEQRQPIWEKSVKPPPNPSAAFALDGSSPLPFIAAFADVNRPESDAQSVLDEKGNKKGWVLDGEDQKWHHLTLLPAKALAVPPGSKLEVTVKQVARHDHCPAARLRISVSEDERISEYAGLPASALEILALPPAARNEGQRTTLGEYYRANLEPGLKPEREQLARLKKQLAEMKPNTVPVMRELAAEKHRKTHLQFRGNYLALGDEVTEAVPAAFHPLSRSVPPNRLAVARWLVAEDNPLTARVTANRFWEQIFGLGLVRTSEDFGSQGERPTHPELLDWLACQFRDGDDVSHHGQWDIKALLKLLVTSAAYCQSSRVTAELQQRDPDNLLLARGPRFRMAAEVVRDQALAVSGLLSPKMYGPSVRPPQPSLGLTAAFGSSLDWKPSEGEDRYRRALYVEWRRTSPYPSMATFDAPNREVCTLRRPRSNTPLQALVTLNDPVYIEAAQSLARRITKSAGANADRARYGFRLCLARPPEDNELRQLTSLYDHASAAYAKNPEPARQMATEPLGPAPEGSDVIDLAAWTAVANVLLNLDETLMRP